MEIDRNCCEDNRAEQDRSSPDNLTVQSSNA
jgi:hypothetical protein